MNISLYIKMGMRCISVPLSLIENIKRELYFSIECILDNVLYEDLDMNINFKYLEEKGELDNKSIKFISNISKTITTHYINKYKKYNLNIISILEKLVLMVQVSLYAGLNLPIQNIDNFQLHRIIQNIINIYENEIRKNLLIEILHTHFKVATIQRAWRKYKRLS